MATVVVLAALAVSFLISVRRFWNRSAPVGALLAVAVVLRLLALPLPPTLSDDVYRYIWDGRVTTHGFNPYRHSPDSVELTGLRDQRWTAVAHREVETVYPPLAIAVFSIASLFGHSILVWKMLLVLIDTASCVVLMRLCRRWDLAEGRAVAYLWNPLVVLEIAGMGHVDAIGVLPLLLGVVALTAGRSFEAVPSVKEGLSGKRARLAAAWLALSVLAKLVPFVLMPLWARASRRPVLFATACSILLLAVIGPVVWSTGGVPPGLATYATSWEFNGPLFEPLWRVIDGAGIDSWIHRGLDLAKRVGGHDELWNRVYPWIYPKFLARLLLLVFLIGAIAWAMSRRSLIEGSLLVLAAMILASPTVYPWYVIWVIPFAALSGRIAWLVLSCSLLLAYLPELFGMSLWPWVYLLIWGPFLAAAIAARALPTDSLVSR